MNETLKNSFLNDKSFVPSHSIRHGCRGCVHFTSRCRGIYSVTQTEHVTLFITIMQLNSWRVYWATWSLITHGKRAFITCMYALQSFSRYITNIISKKNPHTLWKHTALYPNIRLSNWICSSSRSVLELQVYLSQVLHLFKTSFIDGSPSIFLSLDRKLFYRWSTCL